MKRFILYLLLVLSGTALLDGVFRIWCQKTYQNPKPYSIIEVENKYKAYNSPAEIAVLGASRADHHYVVKMMEDSLGIHAYNWGFDGESILSQYICFLKALDNGNLKTVILDLSESQINAWVEERLSVLYPYYWENDTIRSIVKEVKGDYMDYLMLSSFLQYNSKLSNMISCHFLRKDHVQGYIPLPYTGIPVALAPQKEDNTINHYDHPQNSIGVKYLNRMATVSKEKQIRFIICLSPMLANNSSTFVNTINNYCKENQIEFWNMSTAISDPTLFQDGSHLNSKGAEQFTSMIIKKLQDV